MAVPGMPLPGPIQQGTTQRETTQHGPTLRDRVIAPTVTTGPITGSRKLYREVGNGLRVPARRVDLTTGEHVDLYDTSGPYTDPDAMIDIHGGLPK
ncbi:MAG: hypothetical protein M3308_11195, partial [Actinomycetota bacterium]|nr:hypothetical protein [Actinomycetota bacterium]